MLGHLSNLPPMYNAVRAFPSLLLARSLNCIALYGCQSMNACKLELSHYSPCTVICFGTMSTNMDWCLQQYHKVGSQPVRSGHLNTITTYPALFYAMTAFLEKWM